MAEKEPVADQSSDEKSRDRSPPFPFISLEKAVERAREFDDIYKRSAGRIANVVPVWGYTAKSSGGFQTVGALKQFGLLEEESAGKDRKVKLTELAHRILKDERPGKRQEALKEAAIKPKVIAEYWARWGAERPPEAECRSELVLERKFLPDAADRFIQVYDDSIRFAGLQQGDSIVDKTGDEATTGLAGVTASIKGTFTANPLKPLVKPMDAHLQDVFNVEEGQAVIQWPNSMGQASYEDFVAWLEIVKRKIKRQIDTTAAAKDVASPSEPSA